MGVETERKYLINVEKWKDAFKDERHDVQQGYILNSPDKIVRIRVYDNKGFITIKGTVQGISRPEFEYEIPVEEASVLLNNFCTTIVKKTRHKVLYKGKTWEVDEFLEENEGLFIAELELESEGEQFELPEWIEKEVTGDKRYYNSYLSNHPYTNWK